MYGAVIASRPAMSGQVRVRDIEDVAFLIKEGEILTGEAGRRFVIAGPERLTYRIHLEANGFWVQELDDADRATHARYLPPREFHTHRLGAALQAGALFTALLIG